MGGFGISDAEFPGDISRELVTHMEVMVAARTCVT
jgi:hypothetical protein